MKKSILAHIILYFKKMVFYHIISWKISVRLRVYFSWLNDGFFTHSLNELHRLETGSFLLGMHFLESGSKIWNIGTLGHNKLTNIPFWQCQCKTHSSVIGSFSLFLHWPQSDRLGSTHLFVLESNSSPFSHIRVIHLPNGEPMACATHCL